MDPGTPEEKVTALLRAWSAGNREAGNELAAIVYGELRRLAAHYLRGERSENTLQPTALVHELYLKLFPGRPGEWSDRSHFLAVAARQLRRIIVDHARSHRAQKRGGEQGTVCLDEASAVALPLDSRLLDLDEALRGLEALDARAAHVVEMRFFGGLREDEIGKELHISIATVKRDWEFARSWLLSQIQSKST